MKDENKMPIVPHEIIIVGPEQDLQKLVMKANDALEGCMQTYVNNVQLYESTKGWIVMIWYKLVGH
ncbi:MAG: hypothetical protein ABSB28_11995 [Candidatus Bathyarchaeia archaeon]